MFQPVLVPADRGDQRPCGIHLLAKRRYELLDDAPLTGEVVVPDIVKDLYAVIARPLFLSRLAAGCNPSETSDRSTSESDDVGILVQLNVARGEQLRRFLLPRSSEYCLHPGDAGSDTLKACSVVVPTQCEPTNTISSSSPAVRTRRDANSLLSQPAAEFQSVEVWEHDVEDNQIELV